MSYLLEICANSFQSAINAQKGGADRIELCANLWEGGTTPSLATIEKSVKELTIPVFVLIRPRGGDFSYSDSEFEIMKGDIEHAKKAGARGIVSGVLLENGQIDKVRTRELIQLTYPLPFTFHRAFDQVPDPLKALEELIDLGVNRILTSGQKAKAIEGIDLIQDLLKKAANRIIIFPGSGINADNIKAFYNVGCREFHFSAQSKLPQGSHYKMKVPMNSSSDIPEHEIMLSDPDKIQNIRKILDELE